MLPTRIVTGTYYDMADQSVKFTLLNTVTDAAADETALAGTVTEVLTDSAGSFSAGLLCQDAALDTSPLYLVRPPGSSPALQIIVPAGTGPIDITDLAPAATPVTPTQYSQIVAQVQAETSARVAADALLVPLTQKGAANGVASLDGAGLVPDGQIPSGIARDTEVAAAVAALVAAAPSVLDTLNELATALGDDPNFATTITNLLAAKAPLASPALTGTPTVNGATIEDRTHAGSTYLPGDTTGATDGQLFAWATALGHAVPVAPSGSSEAAYSENGTSTLTGPVAGVNGNFGTAVAVLNTDIIVQPSNGRPIYLDAWTLGQQTTIGAGQALLEIWETTGTPVLLSRSQGVQLPNVITANSLRNVGVYHPPTRLGPVATQRSFQLRINTFGNGSTPAWQAANTNAVGFKTWLRALAM